MNIIQTPTNKVLRAMSSTSLRFSRGITSRAVASSSMPEFATATATTTTKVKRRSNYFIRETNNNQIHRKTEISSLSKRNLSTFYSQQEYQRNHTTPKALSMNSFSGNSGRSLLQPHNTIQCHNNNNNNNTAPLHALHKRWHGGPHVDHDHADTIHVSFVDHDGNPVKPDVDAYVGESLLQVAQRNDIELEGACEGVCACSTCHVVIPDEDAFYNTLEEASEDEEDMLDMAFGLTETSRLSCQIIVTDEMDGLQIEIPAATRNFYVDGHVPQPH